MRFNDQEIILTRLGRQQLAMEQDEIGKAILCFVENASLDCGMEPLLEQLLNQYDIPRPLLEADVGRYLQSSLDAGVLAEPSNLKICGLDLSITNQCNATCVYCPTPRIKVAKRFITLDEVGKLIDDLREPRFEATFGELSTLEVGGLSEPLLHPRAIDILREFQRRYPTPYVALYTNGALLTEETTSAILAEGLITQLVVSVDGMDDREHRASKGLDYSLVERNINCFLETRDRRRSKCCVTLQVLPYAKYVGLVRMHLGRNPLNVTEVDSGLADRTAEIIQRWQSRVSACDDVVDATRHFQLRGEYRSEADTFAVPEAELNCPWFDYVAHSINVTSNGDVVMCCNDFEKEHVLGNYLRSSLYDVAADARRAFLQNLARNDIEKVPSRCRRKKYCQWLSFGMGRETRESP